MPALSALGLYLIVPCLLILIWRSLTIKPWWVKVITQSPPCTYYFGPFDSSTEAQGHQEAYLEDLRREEAQGITWTIERSQPAQLTIFEE
jgi:hypothetical protein